MINIDEYARIKPLEVPEIYKLVKLCDDSNIDFLRNPETISLEAGEFYKRQAVRNEKAESILSKHINGLLEAKILPSSENAIIIKATNKEYPITGSTYIMQVKDSELIIT